MILMVLKAFALIALWLLLLLAIALADMAGKCSEAEKKVEREKKEELESEIQGMERSR